LIIMLTTLAGFVFQWLREGRQHRWAKEHYNDLTKQNDEIKAQIKERPVL
jgi:hypothetical protein